MENKDLINLALNDVNGVWNKTFITTANCYVIKCCGRYCLPLVYGNALVNGEANPKAYTRKGKEKNTQPFYDAYNKEITQPWIEACVSGGVVGNDSPEDYVIDNIKVMEDGRYMEFEVTKFPELGGNAILAVKDKDGNILWSWHLWAYADEIIDINGFMNVNLGWKWDDESKKSGTNPHYQWGRKDPMLANCDISEVSAKSVGQAIQKPDTFFCYESGNYNWVTIDGESVNYYNYWNSACDDEELMNLDVIKTVYDPCPVGFSIPKGSEFNDFKIYNGGEWKSGFTWKGRFFPAAGYRSRTSGGLGHVGSNGDYWSSAANSRTRAYGLGFSSTYVHPRNACGRANGFSVAPVIEQPLNRKNNDCMEKNKEIYNTLINQEKKTFNVKFEDLYPNCFSEESLKKLGLLSDKNYILLDEKSAKEYCTRNCKDDNEKKNMETAVHIMFNSFYGCQKEPTRFFPVEFDKYLEYLGDKFIKK